MQSFTPGGSGKCQKRERFGSSPFPRSAAVQGAGSGGLSLLNRRTHYWATAFIAVPVLIIICSGVLLQVKKHCTWVQPAELQGTGSTPKVDFNDILASVRGVTALGVTGWDDIKRVDVRPKHGIAKVWLQSGWEVQVDLGTGRVLQTAYRRSDVIESIHDGSFFAGEVGKLCIFLPSGLILLLMWMTGLRMFWFPFSVKWTRRRVLSAKPGASIVAKEPPSVG